MNFTGNSTSTSKPFINGISSIVGVALIPILIFAVVGNVSILCAICLKPRYLRPANLMLANLSMTSLLQMASMISGMLHKKYRLFPYGKWTCHLFPIVHTCVIPAESFTMVFISYERSQKSLRPLEREIWKTAVKKIVGIWVASIIVEFPHGLFWLHDEDGSSNLKCVEAKELFSSETPYVVYICSYFLLIMILPVSFMLRESILLASRLKFLISVKTEWTQYQVCQYKLIRNALVFIVIFICLKLPANTVWFITRMPPDFVPSSLRHWASAWKSILFQIGALNVSAYPLIIFTLSNTVCEISACCTIQSSRPNFRHPMYIMPAQDTAQ